jgi:hypothetical protein
MKENPTKKLLEEGLLQTSGDFTDRLMHKIEAEVVRPVFPRWYQLLFSASLLLILVIPLLHASGLSLPLPLLQLSLSGLTTKIAVALFVLFSINQWLIFRKQQAFAPPK